MNIDATNDLAAVWQDVSQWPPSERMALATRILRSLEQRSEPAPPPDERPEALKRLIGIWKSPHPPDDDDVERLVAEERGRKYG
ncbi:MAG: hypothetical protein KY476_22520 [Planctomycetes bacterium]|nr:hypothetical protein [Planctomycetota bacterium]